MNTDTRKQIETALSAFSGVDLRDAAMGLLTALGYESEEDQSFQLKQVYMANRNAGAQKLCQRRMEVSQFRLETEKNVINPNNPVNPV
ncbi:MAG TPA: hypothetical protein DDW42_06145 [Desulfobacteraceae bacterium]|nr:hypothetical protein [Desulfobacteraceae bacterium]